MTDSVPLPYLNADEWRVKELLLHQNITDTESLCQLIADLNPKNSFRLEGLYDFIENHLGSQFQDVFFKRVLPFIQRQARALPILFTTPLVRLSSQIIHETIVTREQTVALMCAAFFGLIRSKTKGESYPSFSLVGLYAPRQSYGRCSAVQVAKLNCFLHYYFRVMMEPPIGSLVFERRVSDSFPDWSKSQDIIQPLDVFENGRIEDDKGSVHVDFANRRVGGGVFGHGSVQEEIMFCICPELCVSRLLCASMGDNECIVMKGAEQFSAYDGYGDTMQFGGAFRDKTPVDPVSGLLKRTVVAIDALNLSHHGYEAQFSTKFITREVNKAFVGFSGFGLPIATGRWGCGAFLGDDQLKALIQLMAAAVAHCPLRFYTFGDEELAQGLRALHQHLVEKKVTVSRIWESLGYVMALRGADFDDDSRHEEDESVFSVMLASL